jgi:hypothetical protein
MGDDLRSAVRGILMNAKLRRVVVGLLAVLLLVTTDLAASAAPAVASGCNHNFVNSWSAGFWANVSPTHSYYVHASTERFTGDSSSACQDINAYNVTMGPPCTTTVELFVQLIAPNGNYYGPVGPTDVTLGSPDLTFIYLHNWSDPGNGRGYRVLFSSNGYEFQGCPAPIVNLLD